MKKFSSKIIVLFICLALFSALGLFYYLKPPPSCLAVNNSLNVPYASQKMGSNCGSACMEMVLKYNTIIVNQCQIDARFFDKNNPCRLSPCNCQNPSICIKDYAMSGIKSMLDTAFNVSSQIFDISTTLPIATIQAIIKTEIDAKRPIIAFGGLMIYDKNAKPKVTTGNTHFIVITGYEIDSKCNFLYNIYDPYKCPDTCKYRIPLNSKMFSPEQLLINIHKK